MILVTLGTQDKSFKRLLKAIDKCIDEKKIKDKVIVQAGYTKYKSKNMEIFDLVPMEEFNKLIEECDLLITHGGVGSILQGLKKNKKVIASPRLAKYKEHTNDHQIQIVKDFKERGYILELSDLSKLDEVLQEAKDFKPKKYTSNNKNFTKLISNYIEKENHTSWFNKLGNLISNGFYSPLTFIFTLILFYLVSLIGCSYIIGSVFSGLISIMVTYFLFEQDIKNNFRFLFNRIIEIGLEIALLLYFLENFNLFTSKIFSGLIVIIISFIITFMMEKKK